MINDHITVQKATCSSSAALKPGLQRAALISDQRRKSRGKNQTNLSLHCLLTSFKKKTIIIYPMTSWQYIMSSVSSQDSPSIIRSLTSVCFFHEWNNLSFWIWFFPFVMKMPNSDWFWTLGFGLAFCCSSQGKKKKTTVETWRHSLGFFHRMVVIITS